MNRARKQIVRTIDVNVKPCPHCGGKITVQYASMYHFVCPACGVDTMFYGAENNMIECCKRWNKRADGKETV